MKGFNPGGVLDFGLDGGVPPGPQDPNPCLEVKKVPMFRDFAQKTHLTESAYTFKIL